ncbi:MAG: class II aldolase/adducin family protein [Kiritimatiellae bacterium]|nr:class II aldolase/adducin family protein [Kiritimatiellia bacterium]MDD5520971.1 class II aldolase/adducin family protein [Kiritimatiellia bacterium]
MLDKITKLSHEFGTPEYVKGGGGNSSVKDKATLWIKPSGTTLAELTKDLFVAIDRSKIARLYAVKPPEDPAAREALIKDMMMESMYPYSSGRPSVETPLHDSFNAIFVVHTHPPLVNGMTCAKNGAEVCKKLFPEALWVDYIDPGYTLSIIVRNKLKEFEIRHGHEPEMVFIENHGVFVAGNTVESVRKTYKTIMSRLRKEYKKDKVSATLETGLAPSPAAKDEMGNLLKRLMGIEASAVCASGWFKVSQGPLSTDHVVFMKSYPLMVEPSTKTVAAFKSANGYFPRVISVSGAVFTTGVNEKNAELAMQFAKDGALVEQLAEAFGGVKYMSEKSKTFLENWEVEAYRQKVALGQA